MKQATNAPTNKVTTQAVAGALVTVILAGLSPYVEVPVEVGAALVVLVSFGLGYVIEDN